MSLLLVLLGLGSLTISAFIFVLRRSKTNYKNSLVRDAKSRSEARAVANRVAGKNSQPTTESAHEPKVNGVDVTVINELTDAQYQLVKLIFARTYDGK